MRSADAGGSPKLANQVQTPNLVRLQRRPLAMRRPPAAVSANQVLESRACAAAPRAFRDHFQVCEFLGDRTRADLMNLVRARGQWGVRARSRVGARSRTRFPRAVEPRVSAVGLTRYKPLAIRLAGRATTATRSSCSSLVSH